MVVYKHHILIDGDCSVFHLADSDTPDVLIVINSADKYLCGGFRVSLGSRDVVQDCLKERLHVLLLVPGEV